MVGSVLGSKALLMRPVSAAAWYMRVWNGGPRPASGPIRWASAAWRPGATAPVPIAADSRNFLRETPRRPAMCVYLGPEPYKRDTRSTRRSQQVSFTCDLFTGSQPSAQWRSTTVSGGAVRAKAIGDCRLTAVYGPAERRGPVDPGLHV